MPIKDDTKENAPHELRRLRVREVSAVDRPANKKRFLVIKSAIFAGPAKDAFTDALDACYKAMDEAATFGDMLAQRRIGTVIGSLLESHNALIDTLDSIRRSDEKDKPARVKTAVNDYLASVKSELDRIVGDAFTKRGTVSPNHHRGATDMTINFENLSHRRVAVQKLEQREDNPTGVRAAVAELIEKFADAVQRARPTLSRVEAEVAVHRDHPELYTLDLAAEFASGEPVPVAPVVKTHVATAKAKVEQQLEAKVDALFAASTNLSREQCWGLVYENEPQLISRLNKATLGY